MHAIATHIDSSGRLVVPAALRKEPGLTPGTAATLGVADGELRVAAREKAAAGLDVRLVR